MWLTITYNVNPASQVCWEVDRWLLLELPILGWLVNVSQKGEVYSLKPEICRKPREAYISLGSLYLCGEVLYWDRGTA